MFHENDNHFVVNLDYQLDMKELGFMKIKTLSIRCYTIKYDLSLYSLQHNIMHYMIALTQNTLSQSNFKRSNYHHSPFFIQLDCLVVSTIGNLRLTYFKLYIQC